MTQPGEPRIVLVVARAENGVIGRDGGLPWKISSDLKFFRAQTMGKPLIMGRKTFQSIGKPLDGRDNIVVTRNADYHAEGILVATSLEQALETARECARERGVDEIAVIGGSELYRQTLPLADVVVLTEVHGDFEGDAHFPKLDETEWRETRRERHAAGPRDSADYSFVWLERIKR